MTNYERIKNMSVEEMAGFVYKNMVDTGACNDFGIKPKMKCDSNCYECIKQYLESEVDTE